MAGIFDIAPQILGVLFVLVGAAMLGVTIGQLEKARKASPDGTAVVSDTRWLGAAIALLGSGSALLAVGLI